MISVILSDHPTGLEVEALTGAFAAQTLRTGDFELLFASNDPRRHETARKTVALFSIRAISAETANPAAFKNAAIEAAQGQILLFLSAKTLPERTLLASHVDAHRRNANPAAAVVGRVTLPENGYAPLLKHYAAEKCAEFPFFRKPALPTDHMGFNLYNVSVFKSFLGNERFDERFTAESFEGAELAFRLRKKGLEMLFQEDLVVSYAAEENALDFADTLFHMGRMAVLFNQLAPGSIDFGNLLTDPALTDEYFLSKMQAVLSQNLSRQEYFFYTSPTQEKAKPILEAYDLLSYASYCRGALSYAKSGAVALSGLPAKCSIVILTFNNQKFSRTCLEAVFKNTDYPNYEVIVVDNASTDGTVDMLKTFRPFLRVAQNRENRGFARGCNQGAALATGAAVLFLNNDTEALPGWLSPLMEEMQKPGAGIAGSRLLFGDKTIQHAGIVFTFNQMPYHLFHHFDPDYAPAMVRREFQAVTGACLIISRALFLETGGFDEAYVNGMEDIDLCLKVRDKGRKVVYNPASTLFHFEGKSEGRTAHNAQNADVFDQRWSSKRFLWDDFRYFLDDRALPRDKADGIHIILNHRKTNSPFYLAYALFHFFFTLPYSFRFSVLTTVDEPFLEKIRASMKDSMEVRKYDDSNFLETFKACVLDSAAASVMHYETSHVFYGVVGPLSAAVKDGRTVVQLPVRNKSERPVPLPVKQSTIAEINEPNLFFDRELIAHLAPGISSLPQAYPAGLHALFNQAGLNRLRFDSYSSIPFEQMVG